MNPIRIAVPSKGRLREPTEALLRQAGYCFHQRPACLFANCQDEYIQVVFVRPDDVPLLIERGSVDLGFTGQDIVAEQNYQISQILPLGLGSCSLHVLVHNSCQAQTLADLSGKTVGSKFTRLAKQAFERAAVSAHFLKFCGSLEVMIELGAVDAIVDLVETGDSMRAHNLHSLCVIGHYETALYAMLPEPLSAFPFEPLIRRLADASTANRYEMVKYNIRLDQLEKAKQITPGLHSPTVSPLADPSWCAVEAMVKREKIIRTTDNLDQLGAEAIVSYELTNCRL